MKDGWIQVSQIYHERWEMGQGTVYIQVRNRLLTGTFPVNISLLTGAAYVNNFFLTETVQFFLLIFLASK